MRLLIILLSTIILGCKTTKIQSMTLPPRPEREEIETPRNLQECATVICYYEYLLREWEEWGETVERMNAGK